MDDATGPRPRRTAARTADEPAGRLRALRGVDGRPAPRVGPSGALRPGALGSLRRSGARISLPLGERSARPAHRHMPERGRRARVRTPTPRRSSRPCASGRSSGGRDQRFRLRQPVLHVLRSAMDGVDCARARRGRAGADGVPRPACASYEVTRRHPPGTRYGTSLGPPSAPGPGRAGRCPRGTPLAAQEGALVWISSPPSSR